MLGAQALEATALCGLRRLVSYDPACTKCSHFVIRLPEQFSQHVVVVLAECGRGAPGAEGCPSQMRRRPGIFVRAGVRVFDPFPEATRTQLRVCVEISGVLHRSRSDTMGL